MKERDKIFISYASADKQVANRIAECLRSKNIKIWIDRQEIIWGDPIVAKINSGLSSSFMGIVILSNNFFKRTMPQRELDSMLLLAASMQFRILPLYHDLDHHDLLQQYPLLSDIHGEKVDLDCDILASKLYSVLEKVKEIEIIPIIKPQTVSTSGISDDTTSSAKEVSKNEMEAIFTELRRDTTKNRKQATINKLRYHSESKRIWKHSVTWKIILYLLDSDTIDGLYVIEYMIKFSQKGISR
jgi:TIR domain